MSPLAGVRFVHRCWPRADGAAHRPRPQPARPHGGPPGWRGRSARATSSACPATPSRSATIPTRRRRRPGRPRASIAARASAPRRGDDARRHAGRRASAVPDRRRRRAPRRSVRPGEARGEARCRRRLRRDADRLRRGRGSQRGAAIAAATGLFERASSAHRARPAEERVAGAVARAPAWRRGPAGGPSAPRRRCRGRRGSRRRRRSRHQRRAGAGAPRHGRRGGRAPDGLGRDDLVRAVVEGAGLFPRPTAA